MNGSRIALGTALTGVAALTAGLMPGILVGRADVVPLQIRLIAPKPAPYTGVDAIDLNFRRDLGLSTDLNTVNELKAEAASGALTRAPGSIPWPVVLSPAEQQQVDFRQTKVEPAFQAPAIQSYLNAHSDTFAGNYFDNHAGDQVFLFTSDVTARLAELQKIFSYPDNLVVRQVAYTQSQLKAVYLRLSSDGPSYLSTLGIDSVGLDTENNAVVLSGPGADSAAVTALENHYGNLPLELQPDTATTQPTAVPGPSATPTATQPVSTPATGWTGLNSPPFRSGNDIESTAGMLGAPQCTIGWNVYNGANFYVLTAAHCGPTAPIGPSPGNGWVQGWKLPSPYTGGYTGPVNTPPEPTWVGNTSDNTLQNTPVESNVPGENDTGPVFDGAHSDASLIPIGASARSAYLVTIPGAQYWVVNAFGQNQDQQGSMYCWSALSDQGSGDEPPYYYPGYNCGTEVLQQFSLNEAPSGWFSQNTPPATGAWLNYQREIGMPAPGVAGDSGAPVFKWYSSTGVTAVGTFNGNYGSGTGLGFYSSIFDDLTNLGVHLVTGGQ